MERRITRTSYQNITKADAWDVWPLDDGTGFMLVLFLHGPSSWCPPRWSLPGMIKGLPNFELLHQAGMTWSGSRHDNGVKRSFRWPPSSNHHRAGWKRCADPVAVGVAWLDTAMS